jgi:hypothetical protein
VSFPLASVQRTGWPSAARGAHREGSAGSGAAAPRLAVSIVALSAAAGVFAASAAYTAGRLGYASSPWADRAYWLGQALIVVPVAVRLLGRRLLTAHVTVALVVVLAVAEYLLKICYSPLAFTFVDELSHWRSTVNLLHTGKLFTVNYGLPISPQYPGLEEVTSALVCVTGLPVFTAGLIVAGVAYLLFVLLLYVLYREVAGSHRIAGIAALIYSSTPALSSFDAMFVYETLAQAFLGIALLAAWRASQRREARERAGWLALAVLAIVATVITHHVTSYILVAALIAVATTTLLTGRPQAAAPLAALAIISAGSAACWLVFIAPDTLGYFRPTAEGILQGLSALLSGGSVQAPATSAAPLGNQALEGADLLVVSTLLPIGLRHVWRHHRRQSWMLAMAAGSLGWYATLAIRLGTPNGQELAGRMAAFVYIPVSLVAALALARLVNAALLRRCGQAAAVAALAGVLTLQFDGLANGWPPYWERLPGPYQVAGFERSMGPEDITAARWMLLQLGPGNRVAADIGAYPALSSYGYQDPLQDVGYLYTSREYTLPQERRAEAQAVRYVLVDWRLSQSLPASGSYFPDGSYTGPDPLPMADLTKFDHLPGAARIYDSGNIVIYDLGGARYAP